MDLYEFKASLVVYIANSSTARANGEILLKNKNCNLLNYIDFIIKMNGGIHIHNTKSSTCDILLQFSKKWMDFPITLEAIRGVEHLNTCVDMWGVLHMWGEQEDISCPALCALTYSFQARSLTDAGMGPAASEPMILQSLPTRTASITGAHSYTRLSMTMLEI